MKNMITEPTPKPAAHELADIVRAHAMRRGRLPDGMPVQATDAADWWMARQDQARQDETPRKASVPNKRGDTQERHRWITPYNERVTHTLRKFLRIPHTEQRLILAAAEDEIYWRGEDTHHRYPQLEGRTLFEDIIFGFEKMSGTGTGEYKKSVIQKVRNIRRKLHAG